MCTTLLKNEATRPKPLTMQLIDVLDGLPLLLALGCYSLGCSLLLYILLVFYSLYVDTDSIVSNFYAMMLATHGDPSA